MVFTKQELIGSLQNEIRILQHLATKVDPSMLDYRPTPGQRSTIEWFKYLSMMGPVCVKSALSGGFDQAMWMERQAALADKDFAATLAALAKVPEEYTQLLGGVADETFRKDVEMFGRTTSIGAFLVTTVLSSYAAYRTQIFLYLKACGRTELNTMNLWAGMDAPMPT
jgi:hypothetical protein